jgi:tetratricopeptide (TPR) repeat protein
VTLGRTLIEVNDLDAAEVELGYVLTNAPENLAAIRGLAEIHHRRGALGEALSYYQAALNFARHDPDLEQTIDDLSRTLSPEPAVVAGGMSFEQATAEFISALDQFEPPPAAQEAAGAIEGTEGDEPSTEPPTVINELERFLASARSRRSLRAGG